MTTITNPYFYGTTLEKMLRGLASIEKAIAQALCLTFFSTNLWLGRSLLAVTFASAPRLALAGIFGVIANFTISKSMSQNEPLKQSGIFYLNGFFLGLSCGTFLPNTALCLAAISLLSFVCCGAVIVFDRMLRVWDLPQLVLPAVSSIWILQTLSWINPALSLSENPAINSLDIPLVPLALLAGLKGYGQIFFQNDLLFSGAIVVILSRFKVAPLWLLLVLPMTANILCFVVVGSHWAVTSGLTSFGAILLVAAAQSKFLTLPPFHLTILILASGVIELIAIQLFGIAHLFALSSGYVGLVWLAKLLTETAKSTPKENILTLPW